MRKIITIKINLMARTNYCNKLTQWGFTVATGAASFVQTAGSIGMQGANYGIGLAVGLADATVVYFYQGKELEHAKDRSDPDELDEFVAMEKGKPTATDKEKIKEDDTLPSSTKPTEDKTESDESAHSCNYLLQGITLAAVLASTAFDRYYTVQAACALAETLNIPYINDARWFIYGLDLAIAVIGKVLLVDGYAAAKELTATKPCSACIVKALSPGTKTKVVTLAEAVLAEDIIPLILLPASFVKPEDVKFWTACCAIIAAVVTPIMGGLTWAFDGKAIDNHLAHAKGCPEVEPKIELSSSCLVSAAKALMNVSSLVRGVGAGVPATLATQQLMTASSHRIVKDHATLTGLVTGATITGLTLFGNQRTEVKAAKECIVLKRKTIEGQPSFESASTGEPEPDERSPLLHGTALNNCPP